MTEETLKISELGAYTNNSMNKEGLKKLCDKVNNASGGVEYTAGDNIQISAENVISATDTKYTAGTGISISEQNVISANGGSGGEWILRTPNDDWSDLFESNEGNTKYVAKKDMLLYYNSVSSYICKGKEFTYNSIGESMILSPLANAAGNKLYLDTGITFYNNSGIGSSSPSLRTAIRYITFSTDGTSVTFAFGSENSSASKSSIVVYTKN